MDFCYYTYKYLASGGIVIFPLIVTSFLMWGFIFERLYFFHHLEHNDMNLHSVIKTLKSHKQNNKKTFNETGIRAALLSAVFMNYTGTLSIDKRIADRASMRIKMGIGRYIPLIAVLAAVSPLFGLLGTITGMITTFDVISMFGTGNASAMAGGISEALISTQCGLMVAIPGLLMCVYINRRAARLENRIDETTMTIKRYL